MSTSPLTRRDMLRRIGASTDRGPAGQKPGVHLVPRGDLVNTLEFEAQAKAQLGAAAFAPIAGSDRAPFDRITLRPRVCMPVLNMDLSLRLFGDTHFAPILVAPIERQRRFHADGELATVKGASAANTGVVVSDRSSVSLAELPASARAPLWHQVFASDAGDLSRISAALQAGYRAVCVTVAGAQGAAKGSAAPLPAEWAAIAAIVRASRVPVIVKGIATAEAAREAIARGAQGLIVSTYSGATGRAGESPILRLGDIVDAAGAVPVLVDGSFRRGTDIIKALAFGARAVLIGRPIMWGLAAYGADGVQRVIEMLQTELARYMGMCGRTRLADVDRALLKVHARG